MSDLSKDALISLSAHVVSAFVSNNAVRSNELPELIASVHAALQNLTSPPAEVERVDDLKPAVSVKKSVTDEYIISLEDGRKFKSMKRYLSLLGMTPDQYRAKWGLPRNYPMVAPNYAAQRSELARTAGLGRKPDMAAAADPVALEVAKEPSPREPSAVVSEPVEVSEPAQKPKRGRPVKKAA